MRESRMKRFHQQPFSRSQIECVVDKDSVPDISLRNRIEAYISYMSCEDLLVHKITLIHFAIDRGDEELLSCALAHGKRQHCETNHPDSVGRTPIDVAFAKEHVPSIEILVAHGVKTDFGHFLQSLARRNRASTITAFLASRHLENYLSLSVLLTMFEATMRAHSFEAFKALVNSERFKTIVLEEGETHLRLLAGTLLLGNQNAWEENRTDFECVLDWLLILGLKLGQRWPADSSIQESWLHAMADSSDSHSIRSVLERGADVNALDSEFYTPVMRAVAKIVACQHGTCTHGGIIEIVNILLVHRASLDAGKSVWSVKSIFGCPVIFTQLVQSVLWINYMDERGQTLLHYAVAVSDQPKIELLLPKCAHVLNHRAASDGTALSVACRKRDWMSALMLVKAGAESDINDLRAIMRSSKEFRPHLIQTLQNTAFPLQQDEATKDEATKDDRESWLNILIHGIRSDFTEISDLQTLDQLSGWLPAWLKNGLDVVEVLNMSTWSVSADLQLQACKTLLSNDTNVNAYTNLKRPWTLIEYAVKRGLFDCAAALLDAGADPNQSQRPTFLVLDRALRLSVRGPVNAQGAAAEFAKKLRKYGARQAKPDPRGSRIEPLALDRLKQPDSGQDSLHRAIRSRDSDGVYDALRRGLDPSVPDPITNEYPVAMALEADEPSILSILLSGYFGNLAPKPNVNEIVHLQNYQNNADITELSARGRCIDRTFVEYPPKNTGTYLMAAVVKGSFACTKVLLEAGADVNIRTARSQTVLHLLIDARPDHYLEIAEKIVRYNADVFAEEDICFLTPIHMAIQRRDNRLLEILLMSDAFAAEYTHRKRDTKSFKCGKSPLDMAREVCFDNGILLIHEAWDLAWSRRQRVLLSTSASIDRRN